jgi:hypothetical protein
MSKNKGGRHRPSTIDQKKKALNLKLLALAAGMISLFPIVLSPLTADDIANSKTRASLSAESGSFFFNFFKTFITLTRQWIESQGRFFPGAVAYSMTIHSIFQGKGLYKFYLFLLSLTLFLLIFRLCSLLFSQEIAFIATIFALAGYSLRYRYFHDSISSFSGQVPFAGCLLLISLILLIDEKFIHKRYSFFLSIISFIYASLTYEHVATFLPAILLFLYLYSPTTNRLKNVSAFCLLFLAQALSTLIFRAGVNAADSYKLSFKFDALLPTSLNQFRSPLPMSQFLFSSKDFLRYSDQNYLVRNLCWLILGTSLLSFYAYKFLPRLNRVEIVKIDRIKLLGILLLSLNIMVVPSILTGATVQWQRSMPIGEGYLCTSLQSIGLALAGGLLLQCFKLVRSPQFYPIAFWVFGGVISFCWSQNVVWNWAFNH